MVSHSRNQTDSSLNADPPLSRAVALASYILSNALRKLLRDEPHHTSSTSPRQPYTPLQNAIRQIFEWREEDLSRSGLAAAYSYFDTCLCEQERYRTLLSEELDAQFHVDVLQMVSLLERLDIRFGADAGCSWSTRPLVPATGVIWSRL